MSGRFWFDLHQELLVTEFDGTLRNQDVEDVLRAEFADPRTRDTTKHLIDIRRATNSDASPDELRQRAALVSAYLSSHGRGAEYRIALLVHTDVDYGLGRMFEAYATEPWQAMVFRDRRQALEWLGVQLGETDEGGPA